jgi:hypothetical protein
VDCVRDTDSFSPVCGANGKVVKYSLLANDQCSNAEQSGFLAETTLPCRPSESIAEEVGTAIGYLIAFALISVLVIGFVFTFSKDARETAIALFGTDGAVGSFLLRFNCFRRAEATYIYSTLNDQTDPLYQEDDDDEDANELGLYDDEGDDDDEEDDDMLFSMADEPAGANRGLPIADY